MNSPRETASVLDAPRAGAAVAGATVDEHAKQKPSGAAKETTDRSALVATSATVQAAEEAGTVVERQSAESRLPVQLDVGIPIRDFRVKNLLVLEPGTLIQSQWAPGEDVPVASGEVQLAWSEFEVVDAQLAVRLTRLA